MKRALILLILSDIFILSGFGLITPIIAIFIKEDLIGGGVIPAGIAISLFWVVKSVLQLPFSRYIDNKRKKTKFLLLGTLIIVSVPFIYIFAETVIHIYLAQILYAVGAALAYPTWMSLFTANIDKKHRGFEWALWSAGVGISTGVGAFIGGNLVSLFGFRSVFLISGILAVVGFGILFLLDKKQNNKKPEHNQIVLQRRIKHLKK